MLEVQLKFHSPYLRKVHLEDMSICGTNTYIGSNHHWTAVQGFKYFIYQS